MKRNLCKTRKMHKGGWDWRSFFRWRPSWSFFSRSRPTSSTETRTQESHNTSNIPYDRLFNLYNDDKNPHNLSFERWKERRKWERGIKIYTPESSNREREERKEDEKRQEILRNESLCDISFKYLTPNADKFELLKNIEKSSNVDLFEKYRFYIPTKEDKPINKLFEKKDIDDIQQFWGDLKHAKIFIISGNHMNRIGTFIKKEIVYDECNYVIRLEPEDSDLYDIYLENDHTDGNVRVNIKDLVLFNNMPIKVDGGKTKRKRRKSRKKTRRY